MRGDWTPCPHRRLVHWFLPSLLALALILYLTTLIVPVHRPKTWEGGIQTFEPCKGSEFNCPQSAGNQEEEEEEEEEEGRGTRPLTEGRGGRCTGVDFLLEKMASAFSACVLSDPPPPDILLERYLEGWSQLLKFVNSLGALFGFIAEEVESKMAAVRLLSHGGEREGEREGEERERDKAYLSLRSMVRHELAGGWVRFREPSQELGGGGGGGGPPSGCRTLLRLHRAARWLALFLDRLGRGSDRDSSSGLCAQAYGETLARHHGWLVRRAASLAFLGLPSRPALLREFCPGLDAREAAARLRGAAEAIGRAAEVTEGVYREHGMLDLP